MREITGRQVLIFTVCAFGIVVAVNLTLAFKAVQTFPGLEVDNSYVASQSFDERRAAQEALGWAVETTYDEGQLVITFSDVEGERAEVADLSVLVGRTTTTAADVVPEFRQAGSTFTAPLDLAPGTWRLRLEATAFDGTPFAQWRELRVPSDGS